MTFRNYLQLSAITENLLDNIQNKPSALFLTGGKQKTSNRLYGFAFAPDDASHVAFGNSQFYYRRPVAFFF